MLPTPSTSPLASPNFVEPGGVSAANDEPAALPGPTDAPRDLTGFFLGGLFTIAVLAVLNVAHDIALPIVFAFVLKLMFQPMLRSMEKWRIPRPPAAALILLAFFGLLFGMGEMLSQPAANWAEKLPMAFNQLEGKLRSISKPIQETQKFMLHAEEVAQVAGPRVMPVAVQGTRLFDRVFNSTRAFLTGMFTTIVLLFFFMVSGDTFLRRLVEILPRFRDKRQAVDISQQIERDIAQYLFTISMMNLFVGIATGLIAHLTGLSDPMLWGTLAFLLNYIPVAGPFVMGAALFFAGIVDLPDSAVFMPVICYAILHILEGTFITPLLLAQRFRLNPVLVVLSVMFWYWMWGFPGAILSTPMLAMMKIICDRIARLKPLGHFLGG